MQWILYSWSYLAKLVIYYWFIFGYDKPLDSVLVGAVGIYAVLFFTPVSGKSTIGYCTLQIIYGILSLRAARQLYGPPSTTAITLENMLHADMVVHVMLDLLDLISAFRYADLPETVRTGSPWMHTLIGVFIIVGIFMHSYSFPTSAGGVAGQQKDPHQPTYQGDIFLTRKHAALVAMFLVDIPLMFIRIYLWVAYPKNPGFTPFLVKNVIFLPLQAFRWVMNRRVSFSVVRLNQCRLVERERVKSSQRTDFHTAEVILNGKYKECY